MDVATQPYYTHGLLSLYYIPRHIYAILFNAPTTVSGFPYFKPSPNGLGLFFTTPALLYMFRANLKDKYVLPALLSILLPLALGMTYGVTGFAQFGYRFSLDWIPFGIILVMSGMSKPSKLAMFVIALSVLINLWGVLYY